MIQLIYPLHGIGTIPGIHLTQKFGENAVDYTPYKGHMGIDYGCPTGTPVYAAHDGYITTNTEYNKDGKIDGYGHYIYNESLDHTYRTIYGHLNSFVGLPRQVTAGELIAYSNNSGDSTGPHLHFGLQPIPTDYNNGYAGCIDPLPYLEATMSNAIFVHKAGTAEYGWYLPKLSDDANKDMALNLGREDIIDANGKVDYSKAKDIQGL